MAAGRDWNQYSTSHLSGLAPHTPCHRNQPQKETESSSPASSWGAHWQAGHPWPQHAYGMCVSCYPLPPEHPNGHPCSCPGRATAASDTGPASGKDGAEPKACLVATYQKMYKLKYYIENGHINCLQKCKASVFIFSHLILAFFLIKKKKRKRLCLCFSKRIKLTHILTRSVYYPNPVYKEKAMSEILFVYPSSKWDYFLFQQRMFVQNSLVGTLPLWICRNLLI